MHYQIGDLVVKKNTKKLKKDFGIVINIKKANSTTLTISNHSQYHLKNSLNIYYVFFPNDLYTGPYYNSELLLQ